MTGVLAHVLGLRPNAAPVRPRALLADVDLARLATLPDQVPVRPGALTRRRS